jgi:hypothetical protein
MILGRHPYTRNTKGGLYWFKKRIEKYTGKHLFNTTFTEFVDYIFNTPTHLLDIHLSPQSFLAEDVDFSHLIRVENFTQDLQQVSAQVHFPLVVPKHIKKNKTNYFRFKPEEITENTMEKIYSIYDLDFKKFNHTKYSVKDIQQYIEKKSFAGPVHIGNKPSLHNKIISQ